MLFTGEGIIYDCSAVPSLGIATLIVGKQTRIGAECFCSLKMAESGTATLYNEGEYVRSLHANKTNRCLHMVVNATTFGSFVSISHDIPDVFSSRIYGSIDIFSGRFI